MLLDRGDGEGARAAYEGALEAFNAALRTVEGEGLTDAASAMIAADLYGGRAGLLRRLGRLDESLDSYRTGADLEQKFGSLTTYNRANAVKLALLSGASTLAEARPALVDLRQTLHERLRTDETAADDPWLWADLGDCLVLLGETAEAIDTYRVFVQRAQLRSPATMLAVLRELSDTLTTRGDPDAEQLAAGVVEVELALGDATA